MNVSRIIAKGPLKYTHHFMQTMTNEETCDHEMSVPKTLVTLSKKSPSAKVVVFGDETLGIEVDGNMWAIEMKGNPYHKKSIQLNNEIWQYIKLAMGRDGDTYASTQ